MEGLGEFAADQKRKIRIFAVQLGVAVAVTVNSNNAVRIFSHHITIRVHAEGAHHIIIGLGAIKNLRLINLVRDMLKYISRHLYPHTYIHLVIDKGKAKLATFLRIPFRTGTTGSGD